MLAVVIPGRARIVHESGWVKMLLSGGRVLRNFGFMMGGRFLGDASIFLLIVVWSRVYGQVGIGQYSFAVAVSGFFAAFAGFGLYPYSVKELARSRAPLATVYGRILSLRLLLTVAALAILLLVVPFLPFTREFKLVIVIIGVYQLMSELVQGLTAVFVAREEAHISAMLGVSRKAASAAAGIAVALSGGSLVVATGMLPAISALHLLAVYGIVTKRYGRPALVASVSSIRNQVREAVPYAASRFLSQASSRVDIVLVGFLIGAGGAGVYNVAYRVVFLLALVPRFAALSLFPRASTLYADSVSDFSELYHRSLNLIVLLGLPIAAGVWLIAPDLVLLTFGEEFREAASVLRILTVMLFFTFVSRTAAIFLMACDRQAVRTWGYLNATWVTVAAGLLLIPRFGIEGAAVAAVLSEAVPAILFVVWLRPVVGWPRMSSRLVIGGLGAASFCAAFVLLPALPMSVVIPASVLIYAATLVLFKETRTSEVRALVGIVRRSR